MRIAQPTWIVQCVCLVSAIFAAEAHESTLLFEDTVVPEVPESQRSAPIRPTKRINLPLERRIKHILRQWSSTGTCAAPALGASKCHAVASIQDAHGTSSSFQIGAGGSMNPVRATERSTTGLFEIASNSKVFATLTYEILVRKDVVKSSDTMTSFLPPATYTCPAIQEITLERLALHKSGLPPVPSNWYQSTHTNFVNRPDYNPYYAYTLKDLMEWLTKMPCCKPGEGRLAGLSLAQMSTETPSQCLLIEGGGSVGSEFYYSNMGVGILGYALEKKSGVPIANLMKDLIFDPLEMTSTTAAQPTAEQFATEIIEGHDLAGKFKERALPYGILKAQGSIRSSVSDMQKFLRANLKAASHGHMKPNNLLHQAMLAIMQVGNPSDTETSQNFGNMGYQDLGWATVASQGRQIVWKSGNVEGYSSVMSFDVNTGLSVLLYENCGNCGAQGQHSHIAQIHAAGIQLIGGAPPTVVGLSNWKDSAHIGCSSFDNMVGKYTAHQSKSVNLWEATVSKMCTTLEGQQGLTMQVRVLYSEFQHQNGGFAKDASFILLPVARASFAEATALQTFAVLIETNGVLRTTGSTVVFHKTNDVNLDEASNLVYWSQNGGYDTTAFRNNDHLLSMIDA